MQRSTPERIDRVLVLAGSRSARRTLTMRLARLGLKPEFVGTPDEVLGCLASTPPIAVLVDIPNPAVNPHVLLSMGPTLTGPAEVPIVLTSRAYAETSAEAKALLADGAFAFIGRPALPERWRQVFHAVVKTVSRPWRPDSAALDEAADAAIRQERPAWRELERTDRPAVTMSSPSPRPAPPERPTPPPRAPAPPRPAQAPPPGPLPRPAPTSSPAPPRPEPQRPAPSPIAPRPMRRTAILSNPGSSKDFPGLPPNALVGRMLGTPHVTIAARSLLGSRLEVLVPPGHDPPEGDQRLFFAFVSVLRDANQVWNLRMLAEPVSHEQRRMGLLVGFEVKVAQPEDGLRALARELSRYGDWPVA